MTRAAVLDVGCHSALFTVVRRRGASLEPVFSHRVRLRLHERLDSAGRLDATGVRSVERAVVRAIGSDARLDRSEVFAFATSVIRDAPNREAILARVARTTGTRLRVLAGEEEARLAYVAARRWAGGKTGAILVVDIGGGTLEVAAGGGDQPGAVHSLPLGARQVTRQWLPDLGGASARHLAEVRSRLRQALHTADLPKAAPGVRVLACSKTFEQLAAFVSARDANPGGRERLALSQLRAAVPALAAAGPVRASRLPGISPHRAQQSLAGALIAEALMEVCGADTVEISPWSTREGLLLERLDTLRAASRRSLASG
jgi:exopolyphosphatase/guanosine-5'-triphosphate,3'-diphosphate pyrophosphatase